MTKQEVIKKAYGDYYEKMKPWINGEGFFNKNAFYQEEFKFKYQDLDIFFSHLGDFMIPQSIIGITNNNGWIKIEREDDLPKEDNLIWVMIEDLEGCLNVQPDISNDDYYGSDGVIYHSRHITHYQPIITPIEPLY